MRVEVVVEVVSGGGGGCVGLAVVFEGSVVVGVWEDIVEKGWVGLVWGIERQQRAV